MFVLDSQIASEELGSGAVRKIKGYIDDLMLVELTWKAGQEGVLPVSYTHLPGDVHGRREERRRRRCRQ